MESQKEELLQRKKDQEQVQLVQQLQQQQQLRQQQEQELLVTQQADIISHINYNIYPWVDNNVSTTPIIISNISEDAIINLNLPTLGSGPIMYKSFLIGYNNQPVNPYLSNLITNNTLYKNIAAVYEGKKTFKPFDTLPSIVDKYTDIDMRSMSTQGKVKIFTITITYITTSKPIPYITASQPKPE